MNLCNKFWSISFLLLSVSFLSACSTIDKNTSTDSNVSTPPAIIEENTNTDANISITPTIVEEYLISDNFLLREYQILDNNTDPWFAVVEIESGNETEIRISESISLERIIDENNIVFISNGKTSETVGRWFPQRLYFERERNDALFEMRSEPILFTDTDIVEVGSPKECSLTLIQIEDNSISFDFGAADNSGSFYAGYVDIPMTTIRFENEKNLLQIHFEDTWQADNMQIATISDAQDLICECDVKTSDSNLDVYIKLNGDRTGFYGQKEVYEDVASGKRASRLTLSVE